MERAEVAERCQEEALRKQVKRKMKKRRKVERRRFRNEIAQDVVAGIKEKASAHEESSEIGTARKSKTRKRRKRRTGRRRTRWKCNGLRTRSWRRSWNEEGGKEVPCRRKSC